ncbi:MAG: ATP-binding protein, partial [Thermoanaerobaculia bacterium]
GSGLGLAIVSELAELYGGSLDLDTAPGGGVRVHLVLPAGALRDSSSPDRKREPPAIHVRV